jgi:signal transduction histidine kinase
MAFDLAEWLDGHSSLLRALLLEGQRLELDVPKGLPVFADPQSLDQILQNLVTNARDAMAAAGLLRISACASPSMVRLEVRDDGPGIPSDHMAHVFEPFFTTKPSGTGLGLASVRNLVLQNHGTIHVESGAGQGTTFVIDLPSHS